MNNQYNRPVPVTGQPQTTQQRQPVRERHTGRMDAAEAALVIGCREHDIPVLIRAGLLKPLGNPPPNAVKYFAATVIHQLAADEKWLGKVTHALNHYWTEHNKKRQLKPNKTIYNN
jgi:hypothetical protein